jgi:putative transposase
VGRRTLFDKEGDFLAFKRVVEETLRTCKMRIWAYCLMSNHWHFVVWPESDGDLPTFMQQLTNMHVKRWKEHRREVGLGHLYQGRFKSFPVETDDYFYQVVRYVERNALRANMVLRAEDWPWSSLRRCEREDPSARFWPHGLWRDRQIGWILSTSRRRTVNWRRCVDRSSAALLTTAPIGPSELPSG